MSALAIFLKYKGKNVGGYDRTKSDITLRLEKGGIKVFYEQNISRVTNDIDLVIYTPAVKDDNLELQEVRRRKIPLMKRAEVLGMISKNYKTTAVAGTHGKTTTTTLTAFLLHNCGIDCTTFLGGISVNFNSNLLIGKSDWLVAEADEFDRSFLQLSPQFSVITSMDADHLDIYGTYENMRASYNEFAKRTKQDGRIFYCNDHHDLNEMLNGFQNKISYSSKQDADYFAKNILNKDLEFHFDVYRRNEKYISDAVLNVPGFHNVENALGAIAVADSLGIDKNKIKETLPKFSGVRRRFEIRFRDEKRIYIDDYAHHPAEISAILNSIVKIFLNKKKLAVFQPHLYSRTKDFYKEFGESLSMIESVILLPIYPAREKPIEGVNSELILKYVSSRDKKIIPMNEAVDFIISNYKDKEVIITLGAGDIDSITEPLAQAFSQC